MSHFSLKCLRKGNPISYDTTMGVSVDANGFTLLSLRPTVAKRYYVKNSGSDANAGTNPTLPMATLAAAFALVVPGNGDQVLLSEGSIFNESMPWLANSGGFSAQYPTVISSYDPADPTNEAKIGMGHQRSARPTLQFGGLVSGAPFSFVAIKGIQFNPGNIPGQGLSFQGDGSGGTGGGSYILIENNVFAYTALSYSDGGDGVTTARSSHLIIRNNASYGAWGDDGNPHGNVYAEGMNGLVYEDNVNYHSGWRIGGSRDDSAASAANGGSGVGGGATVFNHPFYFQANTNNITVRRNLIMDGSADAGIIRGDNVTCYENAYIHCPAGTGLGPGNTAEFGAFPGGCHMQVYHNLSLAAIDLGSTRPSGYGYTTGNIAAGSSIHHCLLIHSLATPNNTDVTFGTTGGSAYGLPTRPTSMLFDSNVAYKWSFGNPTCIAEAGTPITNTYTNNIWDGNTSGSNTNNGSSSFPNAYTEAALYTAAGVTDYATLVSLAIASPEQHYQRTIRSLAFAGYGVTG